MDDIEEDNKQRVSRNKKIARAGMLDRQNVGRTEDRVLRLGKRGMDVGRNREVLRVCVKA